MPYIDPARYLHAQAMPETPGELNFAITMLLTQYMHKKGLSYTTANDCMGALEGAKLELYRRVVAPYEDKKRAENGDVYGDLAPGYYQSQKTCLQRYEEENKPVQVAKYNDCGDPTCVICGSAGGAI